jgi:hypothetical protein
MGQTELRHNRVLRISALLGILLRFCVIGYIRFPTREYAVFITWPADAAWESIGQILLGIAVATLGWLALREAKGEIR